MKQIYGETKFKLQKVLVTSIFGHEDLLDYLSSYLTQDKMHGKHYFPKGALCWFETNQYGEPNGTVYYARKIPVTKIVTNIYGLNNLAKLRKARSKKLKLNELFARENVDTEQWFTKKPRFNMK